MPIMDHSMKKRRRMAIISSYFEGASYGLLGPQMAATIIEDNTDYDCIVIGVTNSDDKSSIKRLLSSYFKNELPVIGFSSLSGREDLFLLAKELKDEGAVTILAGPQAHQDYLGETGWQDHPQRFKGLSDSFSLSLKGPAEQAVPLLMDIENKDQWFSSPGVCFISKDFRIIRNNPKIWDEGFLRSVNWNNLHRAEKGGLNQVRVTTAQVLQQLGCPYAVRRQAVEIDYPADLSARDRIVIQSKGCTFCDVAVDKGFYGELDMDTVVSQISLLPEMGDARKIPFELINENPVFSLPGLLTELKDRDIHLSQINLILRADYFLKCEARLRDALDIARSTGIRILVSSMGFEAFDDNLLRNFNKGIDAETNLKAILLMRALKRQYPDTWCYSRGEGAIHGFIHPTPWDSGDTSFNMHRNIAAYRLERDILPPHSTPLIIHHACALADWIRAVEETQGITYKRYGSIIGWWGHK